jgi:hypothetical protein
MNIGGERRFALKERWPRSGGFVSGSRSAVRDDNLQERCCCEGQVTKLPKLPRLTLRGLGASLVLSFEC